MNQRMPSLTNFNMLLMIVLTIRASEAFVAPSATRIIPSTEKPPAIRSPLSIQHLPSPRSRYFLVLHESSIFPFDDEDLGEQNIDAEEIFVLGFPIVITIASYLLFPATAKVFHDFADIISNKSFDPVE